MVADFNRCLLYVGLDDILLMTHTVHAMQTMLHICEKFADGYDIRFNNDKSVAMHIGKGFNERCAALVIDNKDIRYVSELKCLGIHVITARHLKFSTEHVKSEVLSDV